MIDQILITTLFVTGLYYATQKGFILYPLRWVQDRIFTRTEAPTMLKWAYYHRFPERHYALIWNKAILNCPTCMPSLWGTILFSLAGGWESVSLFHSIKALSIIIICSSGGTTLLYYLIEYLKNKK